jgi:hypothetical protein
MLAGTAMMIGLGVGCYLGGQHTDYYYDYYDDRYYYYDNEAAISAGIAFMTIGGIAMAASVPMIAIGSIRMKKSANLDITMNASSNGIGLGITF